MGSFKRLALQTERELAGDPGLCRQLSRSLLNVLHTNSNSTPRPVSTPIPQPIMFPDLDAGTVLQDESASFVFYGDTRAIRVSNTDNIVRTFPTPAVARPTPMISVAAPSLILAAPAHANFSLPLVLILAVLTSALY